MRSTGPVPEGWNVRRLGDLARIQIGRTPARNRPEFWDPVKTSGNRWVAIADMRTRFIHDTAEYISDLGAAASKAKRVPAGTPLLSFKLTVGKVSLPTVPVYTNEAIAAIYPNGEVTAEFLMYALPMITTAGLADRAVKGVTLNLAKLRSLTLPVPPLAEQHKIAEILSAVDDAIERTEAVIEQVRVVKKAVTQDLLTRGIPGRHTRFKRTEVGEIPEEWEVVRLGALARTITSGSRAWARYYAANGPVFLRSQNIQDGGVDLSGAVHVRPPDDAEARRTRVEPGDLLISITGEPGHVAAADRKLGEAYVSQHVALVRLKDPGLSPYLAIFLNGDAGQAQFEKMQYGQTRPGLNLTNIRELLVAIPQQIEREALVQTMRGVEERSLCERKFLLYLRSLKTALAQELLTGTIRVPTQVAASRTEEGSKGLFSSTD